MAVSGHDAVVGMVPTTTWDTAATIGAGDGLLPLSIDKIDKGGTWDFDDSSGLAFKTQGSIIAEEANPTIVGRMRWNGVLWCFFAHMIGDDTVSGVSFPFIHTMTYQNESAFMLTLAQEINNTANGILEVSSLKVQGITFEPDGGFWNFNVTTLGTSVDKAGDAVFDGTAADNVTYGSSAQRMRYKANQLRINTQSGGALGSGDVIADARNMSLAFTRDYDPMDDVLKGASTGKELVRAEPIDNNNGIDGTLQFDQVTADLTTFVNLFGSRFKSDVLMSETIGSDAHTFVLEMNDIVMIEPQLALERGQRIPMSHNYMMSQPSATPTGMTNANLFHFILNNNENLTYETNA